MSKPHFIPQDVWNAAERALDCVEASGTAEKFRDDSIIDIARAIMSERNRCFAKAEQHISRYQSLIDEGKGEHGKPGYVTDNVWSSWGGHLYAAQQIASDIRRGDQS